MSYRVINFFTDRQDNGYAYNVGDTFPRDGAEVSESRIAELLGTNNRQRTPMIEEVSAKVERSIPSVQVEKPVQEETPSKEESILAEKETVKKANKRSRSKKNI